MREPDPALTTREYWDRLRDARSHPPPRESRLRRARRHVRRRLHRGFAGHWDLVLKHLLAPYVRRGQRLLEIGCAPGVALLDVCSHFGLQPFGVDFSEAGHRETIRNFRRRGVDPRGIMLGDVTDPAFRRRHREQFDVVWSQGLIEHFETPAAIVDHHVELLKPGGTLVVSIPNLRAVPYRAALSVFAPDVLAAHNLDVMRRPAFRAVFRDLPLALHHCDFAGTFAFVLLVDSHWRVPNQVASQMQNALDVLLINLLGRRDLANRLTSPHLVCIGTRRAPAAHGARPD